MKADLSEGLTAPQPVLTLTLLEARLGICRLDATSEVPPWATAATLFSVTRTADELSIVCPEEFVPDGVRCERGWRGFKLEGPFEFSEVGILSAVAVPLAEAGVGIFAVSTFDTDYVLVKEERLDLAVGSLHEREHRIVGLPAKEN